jgi:hypothetical protein
MWSLERIRQKNEEWAKKELERRNEALESKNESVKSIKIKSANKAKTFVFEV